MQLFNTLTKKLENFTALRDKTVRMYNCGPTVYNFAHIGNLRAYIFADTIKRALEYLGFKVKQVVNITDVGHLTDNQDNGEDRMEIGASREHKTAKEVADFFTQAFFQDIKKLNINSNGTIFPKASEHIKEQIDLIKKLEQKGLTYKTSDGVYFDTSRFHDYGKLGQINTSNLEEGARVSRNPEKRNPTDFALWKFSRTSGKRQQEWPSPWGIGFPGWHIECSAMAMKYLGETLDIHTGGIDHIPVHHNNEIAQSESATGKQYVRYWLHNEFVNVLDAKMSKSMENFIRLATLEENGIHPLAYRYWLLTAHYRTPVMFSMESVKAAQNALESVVRKICLAGKNSSIFSRIFSGSKFDGREYADIKKRLLKSIENDLNTAEAIALLHETAEKIAVGKVDPKIIRDFDSILGLRLNDLASYTRDIQEKIKKLSREREELRKSNKWAEADTIRKNLEEMGYFVDDTLTGPQVRRSLSSLIGII